MTPDLAIAEARAIAGNQWTENDVRRVACALLRTHRGAREAALREAAEEAEVVACRLRGMADAAGEEGRG